MSGGNVLNYENRSEFQWQDTVLKAFLQNKTANRCAKNNDSLFLPVMIGNHTYSANENNRFANAPV
jgi:hypothetical protein